MPNADDPQRTTDHVPAPVLETSTETVTANAGPDADTGEAFPSPGDEATATIQPTQPELPNGSSIAHSGPPPSVPGYELESVLGRGGMGVVYKARHLALKRTVALKMILAGGLAGPRELTRFRIEAEAVARLQHPNIVQVFEVGEAGGRPFCALEFVEGGNLADKFGGKSLPGREAARLVEVLARAMQLAHSRNVVHRDLKPANILLAADGTPKISDFGLARHLDGDSGETQAGAVMGTPSYMAPEQASGRAGEAGPAADVYALGAILYDCLAGRPPFKGRTVMETLEQVRTHEPAAPSRCQAGVPLDLDTICLKCLEKDPAKRYPSAAELADELGRFLRGEPVRARPVGAAERGWRWCRRNPWVAGLSATAAVLLACMAVGSAVVAVQLSAKNQTIQTEQVAAIKAQGEAQKNEQEAIAARKLADQNAQETATQAGIALGALQTLISKVQEQLDDVAGTQQLKEDLLKVALGEADKVHKAGEKSTSIEATRMAALMQLGQLYKQLGKSDEAGAQFRKVYEIAKARVELKKGTDASRLNLAVCVRTLADMDREVQRDMQSSLAHEKEALAILDDINQHPKTDVNGQGSVAKNTVEDSLADANYRIGVVYVRLGEIPPAAAYFQKALERRRERYAAVKDDPAAKPIEILQHRLSLSAALLALGDTAYRLGDSATARVRLAESLTSLDEMFHQNPKTLVLKQRLAGACLLVGDFHLRTGDHAKAGELYSRARTLLSELAQADAKKFDYKWDLGFAHYRLGQLALRTRDSVAARAQFQESLAIRRKLADKDPINERRKMELMLVLAHCGEHAKAAQMAADLEKTVKPDTEFLIDLARTYAQCAAAADADPKLRSHYSAEAVRALRSAVARGYSDQVYLKLDVDLDPLRTAAEFTSLLRDVRQSAPERD